MARTPTLTWAFMVRAGSEQDLVEELGERHRPEVIAEGLVVAASRPRGDANALTDLGFARQAMLLDGPPAPLDETEVLADRVAQAMLARVPRKADPWTWSLQVVPPDSSDPHDVRRTAVAQIEETLREALLARLPEAVRKAEVETGADRLVQVWAIDETSCLVGVTQVLDALSTSPGGRVRMRRPEDAPSRAGLKLEEAIAWIGLGPEKGDRCVDLGASPGGWSQVAVRRGATVVAIDPAPVKVQLPPSRFTQVTESAFEFAPSETYDWLLCDMAWRPLEVAMLIAKWGRRVWGRQLIANFKLPMRKKAEILEKVKSILESGGWKGIRARQLYFDRDEVTLFAWLDPNVARKGVQAPFRLRSRSKRDEDGPQLELRASRGKPRRAAAQVDTARTPRAAGVRTGRASRTARDERDRSEQRERPTFRKARHRSEPTSGLRDNRERPTSRKARDRSEPTSGLRDNRERPAFRKARDRAEPTSELRDDRERPAFRKARDRPAPSGQRAKRPERGPDERPRRASPRAEAGRGRLEWSEERPQAPGSRPRSGPRSELRGRSGAGRTRTPRRDGPRGRGPR